MTRTRATLVCFGCGGSTPEGLHIYEQYLCPDCETKLLRSNVNKMDYQHWVDVCRKFWETTRIDIRNEE
jgi:DNA-directed RNA polymerase subunit RPC12/RpoP